jgi:two-component system chemotaxis response regulator CheB
MVLCRDVVVIGGSAGAVEGMIRLAAGLPASVAARVFLAIHVPATSNSMLPRILARSGHLPARHPNDGDLTEPGMIYVARPDHHLLVRPGSVRVVRGPRENGHRPAIDPLFRSAAASYGARVVCVALSGNLDDGAAGALAVHHAGGTVIVQDPEEAVYPGIPSAVLATVPTATVLPLDQIAQHVVRVLGTPVPEALAMSQRPNEGYSPPVPDPVELEEPAIEALARSGEATGFTCPECHGGIFAVQLEGSQQFRCRVGHAFTAESLFAEQNASLEAALWTALRALEESAEMARRLQARAIARGNLRTAEAFAHNARTYDERARVIRDLLRVGLPGEGDGEMLVSARPPQQ